MSRMLWTLRSFRMLCTEVYSLQSSGNPSALFASTVSYPSSCLCAHRRKLGNRPRLAMDSCH